MILMRGLIKKDLLRINRIIPGVLGGRQGGFAAPLGALLLFQEILFYLIAFEAPPRNGYIFLRLPNSINYLNYHIPIDYRL